MWGASVGTRQADDDELRAMGAVITAA